MGSYKNDGSMSNEFSTAISFVWLEVKVKFACSKNGNKSSNKYFKISSLYLNFKYGLYLNENKNSQNSYNIKKY